MEDLSLEESSKDPRPDRVPSSVGVKVEQKKPPPKQPTQRKPAPPVPFTPAPAPANAPALGFPPLATSTALTLVPAPAPAATAAAASTASLENPSSAKKKRMSSLQVAALKTAPNDEAMGDSNKDKRRSISEASSGPGEGGMLTFDNPASVLDRLPDDVKEYIVAHSEGQPKRHSDGLIIRYLQERYNLLRPEFKLQVDQKNSLLQMYELMEMYLTFQKNAEAQAHAEEEWDEEW